MSIKHMLNQQHTIKTLSFVMLSFSLTACMVGPNYQKPAPEQVGIAEQWHAKLPHGGELKNLAQWWQQFNDPAMTSLIEQAEKNNPSIAKAVGSVREARANLRIQKANQLPTLDGNAGVTRAKSGTSFGGTTTGITTSAGNSEQTTQTASLDASWEIDLFGKIRRGVEASRANLASAEFSWDDARVSLAAEVANAYINLRQCEVLVNVYETELSSNLETDRLTNLKLKAGFVPPSDQMQTEAAIAESETKLETQKSNCAQYVNQLVALTSLPYADVEQQLTANVAQIPMPPADGVPAIPAVTISQRPDVAATERLLNAASANIGVAIAKRLPSISLTGAIGVTSISSQSYNTWSFGPSLSLPIFDGGSGAANVEAARAKYDQALATYRSQVLTAVQEVENALVRVDSITRREVSAEKAEERYSRYFASIQQKYQLGAASLLELEQVRRTLLSSREQLAAAKLERSAAWVALYKAAGGGWQPVENVAETNPEKTTP
ncbi:efflux transporter outer membrane subunit [Methyloradius palustris]|uniref:Membrane protein n=1 Tax=Methyloradius palustris TaxID=2778876 RepID=A0A8D5FX54_9PROT|nr:efflux transporter outer membrane subunit [Methyloradius palustris]BCM23764.1 membrane protein [Methyloradius palustris]